jgi:hypothetical protein
MMGITEHVPKVRPRQRPSRQLERRPAGSRGADCARLSASCYSECMPPSTSASRSMEWP